MRSYYYILILSILVVTLSCSKKASLSNIDAKQLSDDFSLNREGKKFIQFKRYMNGGRVFVYDEKGSEITIVFNENLDAINEIFIIKEHAESSCSKKIISVNEKGEVQVLEK